MKRIIKIFCWLIVIIAIAWVFIKITGMPSLSALFKPGKPVIENSPVVVKQIQALSQLVTVSMYDEIVADTSMPDIQNIQLPFFPGMSFYKSQNRLVIVGKVTVHMGIDMQQAHAIYISGTKDSLHISLPPAQVLDAVVNPSGVEVFIEDGEWNSQAVARLKNKVQELAVANAQSRGLLTHAQNKAQQILHDFFIAAGYEKVVIDFKRKPATLE